MRLGTFVTFLLIVGAVFFIYSLVVKDVNDTYGTNINKTAWEDSYNYLDNLNSTISPLEQKFKVIQDEEQGFFTKLTAGITAIPYAVIIFPQVIFGSLETGGKISTGFLTALAIPGYLILVISMILLWWAMTKLLEFFQRSNT